MKPSPLFLLCVLTCTCPGQTPNWTFVRSAVSPAARGAHAMVFDAARDRTLLFGGSPFLTAHFGDTWQWNGTSWLRLRPTRSPPGRLGHRMTYDSSRARAVMFGGRIGRAHQNDTWEWDGTTWTQAKNVPGQPLGRVLHAMAYDSLRGETVMFGGATPNLINDTWAWNGSKWIDKSTRGGPVMRWCHAMAFDRNRGRVVLFGGETVNKTILRDTWEWDGRIWTRLWPRNAPTARLCHAMVYDAARGKVVLFGGSDRVAEFGDTWEWDGRDWARVPTRSVPTSRQASSLAFDSNRQRVVMFGGYFSGAEIGDTWELGFAHRTLRAAPATISIRNGGSQTLTLDAGPVFRNKPYWVFGSITGYKPGTALTGIHVPLNADLYTDIAARTANRREFQRFRGVLNGSGAATATLNIPPALPIPSGLRLHHACVVYDAATGRVLSASNPVTVELK